MRPGSYSVPVVALAIGLAVGLLLPWLHAEHWTIVYVAGCVFMVAVALLLSYWSAADARVGSPAFLFVVNYTILVFLGCLVFYMQNATPGAGLVAGGLLAFAVGAFAAGSGRRRGVDERESSLPRPLPTLHTVIAVSVGLLVFFSLTVVVYKSIGIPLLSLHIYQSYSALNTQTPRYTVVALYDLPMVIVLLLLARSYQRHSTRSLTLSLLIALVYSFVVIATSRRYPIMYMGISALILTSCGRRLRSRRVLILAVFVTVVALTYFFIVALLRNHEAPNIAGAGLVTRLLAIFYNRFLYSQADIISRIVGIFPLDHAFFGGYTFADQLVRFPWQSPQFDLATWLYPQIFLDFQYIGYTHGFAPPTLLGEFYANFGSVATLVLMALWGGIVARFEYLFRPLCRRHTVYLVGYSMLAMFFVESSVEGIYGTLRSLVYTVVLVVVFAVVIPQVLAPKKGLGVYAAE